MFDAPESTTNTNPASLDRLVSKMLDLPRVECLRLLAANRFGRLAVATGDGAPLIRPVNYMFDDRSQSVVFRTTDGSKLHGVLEAGEAAFEIDGVDEGSRTGWSVVIRGVADEVSNPAEIRRLDSLGVTPWAPGSRRRWVRIRTRTVTGKRIVHALSDAPAPAATDAERPT